MTFTLEDIITRFNNDKHRNNTIFFLLLLICLFKIPSLISSDIQPWDEGMYAVRVLSVHTFGDFFDQVSHSVANFDSGSHPPLLIWLGYFFTLIFGNYEIVFKLIPFAFSLLCIVYIIKTGELICNFESGFFSSLIFTGTYFFTIYSKRFQFDMSLTFFILTTFYYFILFIKTKKRKYSILTGLFFGFSLMTKVLVGLYIPFIIFIFYILQRKKTELKFSDILIPSFIGLALAMPWYLFMILKYGNEYTNFIFGFHLISRAMEIHEGIKPTGFYYIPNILINNIPFAILLAISFIKDSVRYKRIDPLKIFLWLWFITGVLSISLFKTKTETYIIPFVIPACILIVLYVLVENHESLYEKISIYILTLVNIFWLTTQYNRNKIFDLISQQHLGGIIIFFISIIILLIILFFVFRKLSLKFEIRSIFFILILISFFTFNIYYMLEIPQNENSYVLSNIKKESEECKRDKILYVSSDYKYNPQFTYYFEGIDIGWKGKFNYELADLKNGTDSIKNKIQNLERGKYILIVERDYMNPGTYYDTKLFVPERFKLIIKSHGYEMYLD